VALGHSYLGQDNDSSAFFFDFDEELGLEIARDPTDWSAGPVLSDSPSLVKETRSVKPLEVAQGIFKGHPEHSVVAKLVFKLGDHVVSPFLGSI
jgi:hypothetical protein